MMPQKRCNLCVSGSGQEHAPSQTHLKNSVIKACAARGIRSDALKPMSLRHVWPGARTCPEPDTLKTNVIKASVARGIRSDALK